MHPEVCGVKQRLTNQNLYRIFKGMVSKICCASIETALIENFLYYYSRRSFFPMNEFSNELDDLFP